LSTSSRRPLVCLFVLLVLYLLLALAYWTVTPIYEGPDEPMHYAYVRHLVKTGRLPPLTGYEGGHPAHQESSQPPLYYIVAALLTSWTPDRGDYATLLERNPHFAYPAPPTVPDNKNTWLHTPTEDFPWRSTILAIRLTRLVSLLFGALGIIATWGLGRELWPSSDYLPLLAAGVAAFTPQFLFMSVVVSNDTAATALSACVLWVATRLARRSVNTHHALLLGLLLGLAALTKLSALGLVPLAMFAVSVRVWQQHSEAAPSRRLSFVIGHLSLAILTTLAVSGWWYARNWILYGNPFNTQVHMTSPWAWDGPRPLRAALAQMGGVERSFWGMFGTGNVGLPDGVYMALRVGWLLALAGWGLLLLRPRRGAAAWIWALLWAWCLLILVLQVRWMQLVLAPWGRLLFPALSAIVCLLVEGWRGWLPTHARPTLLLAPAAGLLLLSGTALLATIRPAYSRPPQLDLAQLAAPRGRTQVVFGSATRLLVVEANPEPVHPGEWTWVKLCWESLAPLEEDYEVFVHFVGPADSLVAIRHTYAGLGRFPTSAWQPGDAFCDTVRIWVEEWAPAPGVYDIEVGLYDPERYERLEARDEHGHVVAPVFVGRAKVWAAEPPAVGPPHAEDYILGNQIALLGYDLEPMEVRAGEPFTLTLYWRAERRPETDYTVFVHLLDEAGNLVAQMDGPPQGGAYPTPWWEAGDEVEDVRRVALPADAGEGTHRLVVGLYQRGTMERLPVFTGDGMPVPDGAIRLTEVHVVR
jgi:4-amino-4-deoxy-L-arabinose transferase-like glycosyltransferase